MDVRTCLGRMLPRPRLGSAGRNDAGQWRLEKWVGGWVSLGRLRMRRRRFE